MTPRPDHLEMQDKGPASGQSAEQPSETKKPAEVIADLRATLEAISTHILAAGDETEGTPAQMEIDAALELIEKALEAPDR